MATPIELTIVLVTLLLVGSTWLLYRLVARLQVRP
jgi:hypothetical protein